jgi:hypothetical protein
MNHRFGIKTQADTDNRAPVSSAPWLTPGPVKEAWKNQGNHYDYRDLKASRPADLEITISGPRQFSGV